MMARPTTAAQIMLLSTASAANAKDDPASSDGRMAAMVRELLAGTLTSRAQVARVTTDRRVTTRNQPKKLDRGTP